MPAVDDFKYGIVIDSGSSGSRLQIYKWENPSDLKDSSDESILQSVPKIHIESKWNHKITPGISKYNKNTDKIWESHFKELVEFAENIIPSSKYEETPIFVLATAGMRLLKEDEQNKILQSTCEALRSKTSFYIPNCEDFVQIIDGETEGVYGWLGLNYLMNQFDNYKPKDVHESIGFMDMGGASTQIAFVPNQTEIERHHDDLVKVSLRNINGEQQEWNVFVSTWLGFGANEARRRYLDSLISSSSNSDRHLNDPCLPEGSSLEYENDDGLYNVNGSGDYESCLKAIYPLLLKELPCNDDPCLFNGVHGPKLDFKKDKFVGISEYWYTANDIFESGGEYNFQLFNEKAKTYCESSWEDILDRRAKGSYLNLGDPFLLDACFKAGWVINVLHEGFELPRIGMETDNDKVDEKLSDVHVPFRSAASVNGDELSWTLGKILLFASSQIPHLKGDSPVGIFPSEISQKAGKMFVPGGASEGMANSGSSFMAWVFVIAVLIFLAYFLRSHFNQVSNTSITYSKIKFSGIPSYGMIKSEFRSLKNKIPFLQDESYIENELALNLEEGLIDTSRKNSFSESLSVLRTRSTINLSQLGISNGSSSSLSGGSNNRTMSASGFPKKTNSVLFPSLDFENMRTSIKRSASSIGISRPKSSAQ